MEPIRDCINLITDMEEGIEEHLLSDDDDGDSELQTVIAHISFNLEDKPKELLYALEKIKVNRFKLIDNYLFICIHVQC